MRNIIKVRTGTQLTFDTTEAKLWLSLEGCDTIEDVTGSSESLIIAGSAKDIDDTIEALTKARRFFR